MDSQFKRRLDKNIGKFSWYKVFNKRVYLPLIAVQLVNQGQVTVGQIAVIAVVTAIVQLVLEVPTGYLADKWGNRRSIILGTVIQAISPLFYIFMPDFWGGMLASVLFFGGFSFQAGAIEAFMHDTLIALNKEKLYAKVMGRAQSYGLIGNVFLITLVPATYPINHSLPFFIGFLSLLVNCWLAFSFTYPKHIADGHHKSPFAATRSVVTVQNIALFLFAGAMCGVANRVPEFRELLFQDIGIQVTFFGAILAAGSILGAILGQFVHLLDRLKPLGFYFIDMLILAGCLVLIGFTKAPWIAITGFTLFVGYSRVRLIIFQAKLLHDLQHAYKATLLSALNLFTLVGELGAITLLSRLIGYKGYSTGYLLFGISVAAIGLFLWLIMVAEARQRRTSTTI